VIIFFAVMDKLDKLEIPRLIQQGKLLLTPSKDKSAVWDAFEKISKPSGDMVPFVRCRHCLQLFKHEAHPLSSNCHGHIHFTGAYEILPYFGKWKTPGDA
jgi:hypothetical protein